MSIRRIALKSVAVALAAALIAVPAIPALADDVVAPPVIPTGVVVAGIDLGGMTADQATQALSAYTAPTFAPLVVDAGGTVATLETSRAVSLDVAGLVAAAMAQTGPASIDASFTVDGAVLSGFVKSLAARVNKAAVNARITVVKRKIKIIAGKNGRSLDSAKTLAALRSALAAEIAAGGSQQATLTAVVVAVKPRLTPSTVGKAIIVVLGTRYVYLYDGAKLEKKYRCAVGQRKYPTPTGVWRIVRKVKNPVWHNPWSPWSKKMPAIIRGGSSNPLGTRALYLNASGIRIHGIPRSENSSIGRAASHGCIRLKNTNAVDLFPRVPVGTPVYIVK